MFTSFNKTFLFLAFIILGSYQAIAQLSYEAGYFIDNKGEKIEGFIENADWNYNPRTFNFKSSEQAVPEPKTIEMVQEFGIHKGVKYQRFRFDLDRSSGQNELPIAAPETDISQETLFLKLMIEGKGSLYQYLDEEVSNYFYSLDQAALVQLISKDYLNENKQIVKDQTYIKQISSSFYCDNLPKNIVEKLSYSHLDLLRFFKEYNLCQGSNSVKHQSKRSHKALWITLRPGLSSQTVQVEDAANPIKDTDFGRINAFRIGLEAEYFLRYSQNQWSLLFEPSFQQFRSDTMFFRSRYIALEYSAISTALGARHYFSNNEALRLFANLKLAYSFPFRSSINYEANNDVQIQSYLSANIGVGLLARNRFGLEINYWPKQNFTKLQDNFQTISFILGIRFY